MFPLNPRGTIYKSNVKPTNLYGSEVWCLKESKIGILQRIEIHHESNVRNTAQDRKRANELMLSLNEAIDCLCMANICVMIWHVLRRENGHAFRRVLEFEDECQMKIWRQKNDTEKVG